MHKQVVVLGGVGSGRTRYLAKEIAKIIEGGNNAIYITDEHTRAHIEDLVSNNLGTSDPQGKLLIFEAKTEADVSFLLGQSVAHFTEEPSTTIFLDLHNTAVIKTSIEILTAVLPVYDNAKVVYTGLLNAEGVLPEDSPFNFDIDKVFLRGEPQKAEKFEGTQYLVVAGRPGSGRTRHLVKKAIDASSVGKVAVFISDEHTPSGVKDFIKKQEHVLNTADKTGGFLCIHVKTAEQVITALHDIVKDLKDGKNVELLIDLHMLGLIKQAISTINTYLNVYKNLDVTFSLQVNRDVDKENPTGLVESEALPFHVKEENITLIK